MNIVLINDEVGVEVYKSWKDVKKYTSFTKEDFAPIGQDYVLNCNNETYEVSKDVKLLERVASERVFAKQKMNPVELMMIGCFIFSILIYFKH